MKKIGIGMVGCGAISGIYLENITKQFQHLSIEAVCDMDREKAEAACEKYQIPAILSFEELLASDKIDIVLNLTTPQSHFKICKAALLAGKHVYVEKPLSLDIGEGKALCALAEEKGLRLGCAPDTFLGAGLQTCKQLIEDGTLGEIIGATAFMLCHGHESWHPAPGFYYQKGGGPMFDMGPYYLTALTSLMGTVDSVCGMTAKSFSQRTITSQPLAGQTIDVEVPTHVAGLLRFENGAIASLITSFDVWGTTLPRIEIYGTKGSLIVPDPNTFGGEIQLKMSFSDEFQKVPLLHPYGENSRGLGLADMATCLLEGEKDHKASGKLACHVLDIMCALHTSSDEEKFISLTTKQA